MSDLAARDAKIVAASKAGNPPAAIVKRFKLTRDTVYNVLRVARKLAAAEGLAVTEIPVDRCDPSPTARPVVPIKVEALVRSIADVGLRQPINVRPIGDRYETRGGGHRLAAFRQLGRETIPAFIRSDDDLRAELAEIDENLVRNELSPAEEAIAIARRKEIYVLLHPETRHGAIGGGHDQSRQLGDSAGKVDRFTRVTADATGDSERTLQRKAKRGEDIGADSLKRVVGTSLDKGEELDALAKLPEERREQLIAKAEAGESVTARGAGVNGERAIMAGRIEPDNSLDYFPTPPWATRALCEHILPGIAGRLNRHTAWEPACGEGHMAAALDEYFSRVVATDIFDYRYPDSDGIVDFTAEKLEVTPDVDWIITNPPFGDRAEAFVLRAIERARVGVAMFFRLQWLETVGRYERIFKLFPPRVIAQFTERVPLHKGRWEPDGDTATAYLWIVWTPKWSGHLTQFTWIPPGQREALTKSDDRERFTAHPVKQIPAGPRGLIGDVENVDLSEGPGRSPLVETQTAAVRGRCETSGAGVIPAFLVRDQDNPLAHIGQNS